MSEFDCSNTLLKAAHKLQRMVRRQQALRAATADQQWRLFTDLDVQDEAEMLHLAVFMQTLVDCVSEAKDNVDLLERLKQSFVSDDEFDADNMGLAVTSESRSISLGKIDVTLREVASDEEYDFGLKEVTPKIAAEIMEVYRNGGTLSNNSLVRILRKVYKKLRTMPTVSRLSVPEGAKLNVVGDIHGQLRDLLHILDEGGAPSASNKYIFNGDFVDRGEHGMEVVVILFAWFLAVGPDVVCLNRGNHEDIRMNRVYGFEREVIKKADQLTFEMFAEIFRYIPLFTIVDDSVFVVHGGLFHTSAVCLDDLDEMPRTDFTLKPAIPYPQCIIGASEEEARIEFLKQLQRDALWSDPSPLLGVHANPRSAGCLFGPDMAACFMEVNDIDMIIRSHECVYDGFCFPYDTTDPLSHSPMHKMKHSAMQAIGSSGSSDGGDDSFTSDAIPAGIVPLVTLFSASNYCNSSNEGAYMTFMPHPFDRSHPVGGSGRKKSRLHYAVRRYRFSDSPVKPQRNQLSLRDLILKKKVALTAAFTAADVENDGYVSRVQWAEIMQQITGVMIRWNAVIDSIAPAEALTATHIDYKTFMAHFSVAHSDAAGKISPRMDFGALDCLYGERRKLEALFYLFDTNHDGEISPEEFAAGCATLNARLHPDCQLTNIENTMRLLDLGKTGTININEFFEAFRILDGKDDRVGGGLAAEAQIFLR